VQMCSYCFFVYLKNPKSLSKISIKDLPPGS
jgi:hypothetical protein